MRNQQVETPSVFVAAMLNAAVLTAAADSHISHRERIALLHILHLGSGKESPVIELRKSLQKHVELLISNPASIKEIFRPAKILKTAQKVEILLSALGIARLDGPYNLHEAREILKINAYMCRSETEDTELLDAVLDNLDSHGHETDLLREQLIEASKF